jgi:hypothetical protein
MTQDQKTIRFILYTIAITLAWNTLGSLLGSGWITASVICFAIVSSYIIYAIKSRDQVFIRSLIIGLIAGFVELLADHHVVYTTKILVYFPGGPFVSASPLYMPFAWTVVLVQLGYIGYWLINRYNLMTASILSVVLVGINIPYYEWAAKAAKWWFYQNTPMLGGVVSWSIMIAEMLVGLVLPFLFSRATKSHWTLSVGIGIALGLWIWVSYLIANMIIG